MACWGTRCAGAIVVLLAACRGEPHPSTSQSDAAAPAATSRSSTDSAALASDAWSVPEIIRRLREAGLVVTDSGQPAHRDELHVAGHLLRVGRGTLAAYVYSGRGARVRDAAGLDTSLHGLPTLDTPHYVESGNLIAVLQTPDEATVERVTNALTARHTQGRP